MVWCKPRHGFPPQKTANCPACKPVFPGVFGGGWSVSKKPNEIKAGSLHNTHFIRRNHAGQAGGGSQARGLTRAAALIELCLIKTAFWLFS